MIRNARITDAKEIQRLIHVWADKGKMLHRPLTEIFERIRDFAVSESDGKIVGVASLHVVWEDIAEIRSLAVDEGSENSGVGQTLVEWGINSAKELGVKKVFALTYIPDYFKSFDFKEIDKQELPHKIWSDCVRCHKFPDCDEIAVIKTI